MAPPSGLSREAFVLKSGTVSDSPTETPPPPPKDTFWQRRVVRPIVQQLTQGITPEKIALTLAVGTAFAFFPILGTTTLLCLFVGILLRLNQPLIQLVNALCTLPHLFVIYLLFRLGGFLFGATPVHANASQFILRNPHNHFSILMVYGMFSHPHYAFWHRVALDALHAIIAWAAIAPFWVGMIYWTSLPMLREIVRNRAAASAEAASATPPEHPVP